MKMNVLLVTALIVFGSCQSTADKKANRAATDTANFTSIKWIDSVKNIGTVLPGKKTEIKFGFINTGTKPLFIVSAKPGCGCTIANYPEEAIAPGAKGEITAGYQVPEKGEGAFRKNIIVTANTTGSTTQSIFFFGEIKKEGNSIKDTASKTNGP